MNVVKLKPIVEAKLGKFEARAKAREGVKSHLKSPQHEHGDHLIYEFEHDGYRVPKYKHSHAFDPHDKNGNQGLPDSHFEHDNLLSIHHKPNGHLEWVPPMGPAPIWQDKFHHHDTHETIIKRFHSWFGKHHV